MNFNSVLFDMDGVIVDSLPMHTLAAQNVLRKYNFELSDEDYRQHFAGRTDEAGFAHYFDEAGAEVNLPVVLQEKSDEYMALSTGNLAPCDGAVEFVEALARQGAKLAIVTGSRRHEAELTLKTFGIHELFGGIVSADDVVNSKPHPEGYLKGAQSLGAVPARCIVIEDAPDGVHAARRAGMRCVAVTNTCTPDELWMATVVTGRLHSDALAELEPVEPMFDIAPSFWEPVKSRVLAGV